MILGLAVAGMALAYLANELVQRAGADGGAFVLAMTVAGIGVLALWWVFSRLVRHFRDLGRLGADLAALRHRNELSADWETRGDEVGRLAAALGELLRRERRTGGGGRLGAVATALEEPLVVLGDTGRIALLNPAAVRLFGPGVLVGMDVYDLLDRPDLFRAIERARGAGQPVSALLRGPGGAELPAQVVDLGLQAGVALVFPFRPSAHPLLPARPTAAEAAAAPGVDEREPLAALPMLALWVATAADRVVSVATMRLSGARIFRTVSLDVPVNPGEPVPAAALAAHGLTAEEMAGARPFAAAWPVIAEALRHCVVVGVDVDAALAALRAELERTGLPPLDEPPTLDLRHVAAALDPASVDMDLPGLAARFGVVHHAGPAGAPHALLTAELASAMIRCLDERGAATFGEATTLAGGTAAALPRG